MTIFMMMMMTMMIEMMIIILSLLFSESLLKKCQSYVEELAGMAVSSDHQTAVRLLHDICTVKESKQFIFSILHFMNENADVMKMAKYVFSKNSEIKMSNCTVLYFFKILI